MTSNNIPDDDCDDCDFNRDNVDNVSFFDVYTLAEPTKAAKSRVKMSTGLIEIERRDIVAPAGFLKHS